METVIYGDILLAVDQVTDQGIFKKVVFQPLVQLDNKLFLSVVHGYRLAYIILILNIHLQKLYRINQLSHNVLTDRLCAIGKHLFKNLHVSQHPFISQ